MTAVADDPAYVYRDATFSRETRDWLKAAAIALGTFAAIEDDVVARERGLIDDEQLATRVLSHCRSADPGATREASGEISSVVDRWDGNDATEVLCPPDGSTR